MRKPIKPLPTDCCGSGCNRCIYDIYEEHLQKYAEWKEKQEEKQHTSEKKNQLNN